MRLLVASALIALLGACAQPLAPSQDMRTVSDNTDADRRAAPRLELAALYFGRGQYETALDEVKLALAAKPDLGVAHNLRGLIYSAMGEERLADESFLRALQINPRDADTLQNRGWFLCQNRRYDEADRSFELALAQSQYRDASRTLLSQGVCHARAGKLAEAEQKLMRAYEFDSSNPSTSLNLAEVLYRRGELERARFYARRVNSREEFSNAQSLWLALRIENRIGNRSGVDDYGRQLRARFPQSPEAQSYDRGRLDD